MKFPESWLRTFVAPMVDRAELCRRLTMAGLEVEGVEPIGAGLDGVVVGEILECAPHPNADKLRVCKVSTGSGEPLQIVCGAPNARAGLRAALATIGTRLPNGIEIKKAALRGVESSGMLCSAKELALDADAAGLLELPADAPVGNRLAAYLGLPDATIELKLTPNRADCLSIAGLAIDVGAVFGADVAAMPDTTTAPAITQVREVVLQAGADCPRYCGRVIDGIDAAVRTPLWMLERLRRSGIRPVSATVDITQYVMLELGQPMHAYDAGLLDGAVAVRHARDGEKVKLLDGSEHELREEFVVIADARKLHGLAGIMGGMDSRVTEATKTVFLEAAHFAPAAIMGRARKLGLHTDASHRFERGVDPELPRRAIERATALLIEIAGGKAGPVIEAVLPQFLPRRPPVALRRARLQRVLGLAVANADVERILKALDMKVEPTADGWRATPPSRRFDIAIEEDLIEEVVRVHGYERVPVRRPSGELRLALRPEAQVAPARMRAQLVARGYREAICFSFVARELLERWSMDQGVVALANPLSADLAVMRPSLLPGLVQAMKHNLNRQQERVRLFEQGLVFVQAQAALAQTARIAAVACGRAAPESWATDKREMDLFDIKGDLESLLGLAGHRQMLTFRRLDVAYLHPGRSAEIMLDERSIGVVGCLHPRLLKPLDLDRDVFVFEVEASAARAAVVPRASALSQFPSLRRDIAIVVPQAVEYATVKSCIRAAIGAALAEVVVFDQYLGANLGPDVKSLAIGLILQDDSRTLTDADADRCMARAVAALERECQARLRG